MIDFFLVWLAFLKICAKIGVEGRGPVCATNGLSKRHHPLNKMMGRTADLSRREIAALVFTRSKRHRSSCIHRTSPQLQVLLERSPLYHLHLIPTGKSLTLRRTPIIIKTAINRHKLSFLST